MCSEDIAFHRRARGMCRAAGDGLIQNLEGACAAACRRNWRSHVGHDRRARARHRSAAVRQKPVRTRFLFRPLRQYGFRAKRRTGFNADGPLGRWAATRGFERLF